MIEEKSYFPQYRLEVKNEALSEWKKLFKNKDSRKYPKKSIIINQGENVEYLYFIQKGLIEYTYIDEDGTEELVEVLGEENLFGLQAIFGKKLSIGSFVTLENSEISAISILEVQEYIKKEANLARELLEELSKITNGLTRQIFRQRLSAEERVKETICYLAEYLKKREKYEEKHILISFSQSELARLSRTTRVTVTKVLSKLRSLKLIETLYLGIIVYDLEKIKAL